MNSFLLFKNNDNASYYFNIKKRTVSVFRNGAFVKEVKAPTDVDFGDYEKTLKTSSRRDTSYDDKSKMMAWLADANVVIVQHVKDAKDFA